MTRVSGATRAGGLRRASGQSDPRLGLPHLLALAAGGVIGSGWLLEPATAGTASGWYAILAWLAGGAVMAAIALVMVELGSRVRMNGGLIFWPKESSGPYVATIIAAALWIFYALNPVSEAAAITKGLTVWVTGLYNANAPTPVGIGLSAAFAILITAINFLTPGWFLRLNLTLTAVKVAVPVLVVILLFASGIHRASLPDPSPAPVGAPLSSAMTSITSAGIIYAYIGFQAPLDFAGKVRKDGMGETKRLRWAVLGTVFGSVVLYTLLEVLFLSRVGLQPTRPDSPYTQFAFAASMTWFAWVIRIDALMSPAGAGAVFSFALTREVDAFSRDRLVHRGLQSPESRRTIRYGSHRYPVFWVILLVDAAIGLLALLALSGSWQSLAAITSELALVAYAMPAVSLVTYCGVRAKTDPAFRLPLLMTWVARVSFTLIAMLLYGAGWPRVWPAMAALGLGVTILLVLPFLKDWWIWGRRPLHWYDAEDSERLIPNLRNWHTDPAIRNGLTLAGYLVTLSLLTLGRPWLGGWGLLPVSAAGLCAFRWLVSTSRRYMQQRSAA